MLPKHEYIVMTRSDIRHSFETPANLHDENLQKVYPYSRWPTEERIGSSRQKNIEFGASVSGKIKYSSRSMYTVYFLCLDVVWYKSVVSIFLRVIKLASEQFLAWLCTSDNILKLVE